MTNIGESKTDLYAIRTDASSATVVMQSGYTFGLMGLALVFGGVFAIGSVLKGLTSLEHRPELLYNWPGLLSAFVTSLLLVLFGGWLSRSVVSLRSITVTPGRATVAWRLFRARIRVLTFDVHLVVVHQDLWHSGKGSTERVVLQGQEQTHTVATVWNVPPAGSFKPPFNNWAIGAGSERSAQPGTSDERTVSPLILGLAKALASAASVPMVLRVAETHGPSVTLGDD